MNRLRNILICLVVFFTQFIPSYANAGLWGNIKATATAVGASVTGSAAVGGASRSAAATVPWGSIKNGLSKGLKGGGNVLLGAAIYAALSATDYVMDPANNSVTYTPQSNASDAICSTAAACPSYQYLYKYNNVLYSTVQAACQAYWSTAGSGWAYSSVTNPNATYPVCVGYNASTGKYTGYQPVQRVANSAYDSTATAPDKTKTVSLADLVQLLIDQMNNNDAAIKNVLDQILESSIAQAQAASNTDADLKAMLATMINALDANKEYATDNTATGTQTTTSTGSDLSLEFPTFCGWAGIVCEAAQTAIDFPVTVGGYWDELTGRWTTVGEWWTTITGWKNDAVEYVDSLFAEPELPDEDNTIPDSTVAPDLPSGNYISFSSTCPFSNQNNSIEINGQTTTIQNDFSDACTIATDMRPVVLLLSALISFGIMAGFNFSGSTQDD